MRSSRQGRPSWAAVKKRSLTEQQLAQVRKLVDTELVALALRDLRGQVGKTQVEVAAGAEMSQGEIARLEGREDMLVSTLHRYAKALGGELEVAILIDGRRHRLAL